MRRFVDTFEEYIKVIIVSAGAFLFSFVFVVLLLVLHPILLKLNKVKVGV